MNGFKGTPGPWRYTEVLGACTVSGGEREMLAYRYSPDSENRANARLIAAAPELLDALAGLYDAYCRAGDDLTRDERTEDRKRLIVARAAIAKATGEDQ